MKRRVMIIGQGYLGSKLFNFLKKCPYIEVSSWSARIFFQSSEKTQEMLLDQVQPEIIINCSGFTGKPNVEQCEKFQIQCLHANVIEPLILLDWCAKRSLIYGHVSSGCIYQNNRRPFSIFPFQGYTEKDPPNFTFEHAPVSFYSGTKALAETLLLRKSYPRIWIWRIRMPFDEHIFEPQNLFYKLLNYKKLIPKTTRNSITCIPDFVEAIETFCLDNLPYGIWNMTNLGSVTTEQLVELIQTYIQPSFCPEYFESEQQFQKYCSTPRSFCTLNNKKIACWGLMSQTAYEAVKRSLLRAKLFYNF